MSYHIKLKDKPVKKGLRRVAKSQIKKAIGEIDDENLPPGKTVHQLRKRCKKLRGLIRLYRPAFPDYKKENKTFRDAARTLAPARDAEVMIETLDMLTEAYADELDRQAFLPLRDELLERLTEETTRDVLPDLIADVRQTMVKAKDRARDWSLEEKGFDALGGGLIKTYARAQKALDKAEKKPTPENFHEWRKRTKYHWYHTRLLREVWPEMIGTRRELADMLSDLLGDHHDLSVFAARLRGWETIKASPQLGDLLEGAIEARQRRLLEEALPLGRRLFAEDAQALVDRWKDYWQEWRGAA